MRLLTGTEAVERAIQTLKTLIIANSDDEIDFTESMKRTLRIAIHHTYWSHRMQIWILFRTEPRTELTYIIKDEKNCLSDWTTLNVSVPLKQFLICVARTEKVEVTNHIVMARKRKIPCCSSHETPKRRLVKPLSRNFQYLNILLEKEN